MEEMRSVQGSNSILFTNKLFARHPDGGLKYIWNQGIPNRDNLKLASRFALNALEKCESQLAKFIDERDRLIKDVEHYQSMKTEPFKREDEVNQLREESKKLDREISAKINHKPKEEPVEV